VTLAKGAAAKKGFGRAAQNPARDIVSHQHEILISVKTRKQNLDANEENKKMNLQNKNSFHDQKWCLFLL
tara:strand:+ start:521 stop:730 length:210 start_codon:yes stop_codon:yes gene_type:complete